MKRAYVGIRDQPVYRRDAFVSGLKSIGLDVRIGPPQTFDRDTIYVCWNRYAENHDYCTRLEKAGGIALIAENAYLAPGGESPHDMNPRTWYALAKSFHNDSTVIPDAGPERFAALGIELKPWRVDGGHILVCPSRHFGTPNRIQDLQWTHDVTKRLQKLTGREVRVRPHPGNDAPKKPLAEDLAGAHAVVIWHSSAGVHALIAGVPVFCEAPRWICKSASDENIRYIDRPLTDTTDDRLRLDAMRRLANAQFNIEEIASGYAFTSLLCSGIQAQERAGITGVR